MLNNKIGEFTISPASLDDASEITSLLKNTAMWLKENHIDQWSYLLSGGEDSEIIDAIIHEETFIIRHHDEAAATVTLYYKQNDWDIEVWGRDDVSAVYLHRLAVKRSFISSGLGRDILNWVNNYLSEKGVKTLRLDCVGSNEKLNQFYISCGFEKIGTSIGHSKFEKSLV